MALSQRRSSSLLDAVGAAGRRATVKSSTKSTAGKRTSPALTPIPVKPPVVKPLAKSRIPVTKAGSLRVKPEAKPDNPNVVPSTVPSTLSDLSWRFDSPAGPVPDAPDAGATSSKGAPNKPAIRPKTATLRRAPPPRKEPAAPAVASRPSQSEEQAIHDLQELVRRQQEELEEYREDVTVDAALDAALDATSLPPLASCSLVQQVDKEVVKDAVVVVEEPSTYTGPLQVRTARLEDQDIDHDVLQDPRLAATRSRLNQRLQHLLDDGGDVVVPGEKDEATENAHKDVVADLVILDSTPRTPPDPRRRSIYFTETPVTLAPSMDPVSDWAPQKPVGVLKEVDIPLQTHVPVMAEWSTTDHAADVHDTRVFSQKDQYHQEIRQLLQKLNSDEALYPYSSTKTEPIYATTNKLRKTRPPPRRDDGQRQEGGGEDEDGSLSPMEQKGAGPGGPPGLLSSSVQQHAERERKMSPADEDDGDARQPGSDLSLSSDNTSGDDGLGEERPSRSWTSARSRGRDPGRDTTRDLSMDSGIQGSSCDLDAADYSAVDSSAATSTSSAMEDEVAGEDLRPIPIGGCETEPAPNLAGGDVTGMLHALGEAFKGVEELYVADVVPPPPPEPRWGLEGPLRARIFTETHFDSAPNLSLPLGPGGGEVGDVSSSAPVGLDRLDRLPGGGAHPQARTQAPAADGALAASGRGAGGAPSVLSNSSIVSLPNVQQVAAGFPRGPGPGPPHSASTSNLFRQQAPLSPPEPFRRALFREAGGIAGVVAARQSKRFSSADDVFRASLLRHSLPAKPPRSPSVRASVDEDLSGRALESVTASVSLDASLNAALSASLPCASSTTPGLKPAPSHQVVVAIDFGTTYSGYAFCYTRDPDSNIHMMRKWEGGDPGLHNEKAPTALLLTPDGAFHSFGFLARDTFHDLHPDHAKRWLYFDKFKMALISQTTLTRDTALTAANGRQVSALTVLSLSLGHLRQRALAELAAADQGDPDRGDPDLTQSVRWVLTVPALWGPSATQLLREAAHEAGLASPDHPEDLLIVLEPEAASLCCRQLRLHQLLHQLHSAGCGDHPMASLVLEGALATPWTQYMVVDCGGGTVDITVHELSGERATLRELHKASGGACGSLGVDREFERLLSAVFGADFMSHFRRKRPAAYVELLLSFEARKRSADPDRDGPLTIFPPFAFVEAYRKFRGKEVEHALRKFGRPGEVSWSSQGMLRLSPQLMADLFRPTLDQVCQQVEEVLRSPRLRSGPGAAPSAIQFLFLVGGFAQSLMLQNRVRSQFGSRVKVVVPQAVGLTTLRGAVLYGLDPSLVASRRSKHTLGVGVLKRFQPGQHPQDKLVTLSDGSAWCCDVLDVLVVADQPLGPGEAVTRSYTPASARQTNIIIHIYCCSDSNPPKFVTDAGVTRCGTLRLALDSDDHARRAGDAAKTREIVARIEFGGTELAASAQDIASGRCVRTQLDFLSTAV